jgi:hypothetical protein
MAGAQRPATATSAQPNLEMSVNLAIVAPVRRVASSTGRVIWVTLLMLSEREDFVTNAPYHAENVNYKTILLNIVNPG